MVQKRSASALLGALTLLSALNCGPGQAQDPSGRYPAPSRSAVPDMRKSVIELPVKSLFKSDSSYGSTGGTREPVDVRKMAIERPIKSLLVNPGAVPATLRYAPSVVPGAVRSSSPLSRAIGASKRAGIITATAETAMAPAVPTDAKSVSTVKSTSLTGLIAWRKDFNEARKASARSGKPVMLFQMMGRLDDRFC